MTSPAAEDEAAGPVTASLDAEHHAIGPTSGVLQ